VIGSTYKPTRNYTTVCARKAGLRKLGLQYIAKKASGQFRLRAPKLIAGVHLQLIPYRLVLAPVPLFFGTLLLFVGFLPIELSSSMIISSKLVLALCFPVPPLEMSTNPGNRLAQVCQLYRVLRPKYPAENRRKTAVWRRVTAQTSGSCRERGISNRPSSNHSS